MGKANTATRIKRQQGAVLVVGLIILVVLTLLGVQAMRTNIVQERMAGNMRERNLAFQAAEAALRVGEAEGPFDANALALPDPVNWDGVLHHGSIADFDAGLAAAPVFHVGPPQYVRIGLEIPPVYHFVHPVTARGVGGQAVSVVVLQSSFLP